MALYREAAVLFSLALVEPARLKDARDQLARFVQAYPPSRHIIPAREDLAKAQLLMGEFKAAEATISRTGQASPREKPRRGPSSEGSGETRTVR